MLVQCYQFCPEFLQYQKDVQFDPACLFLFVLITEYFLLARHNEIIQNHAYIAHQVRPKDNFPPVQWLHLKWFNKFGHLNRGAMLTS